jgi:hypothetical protein
MRWDRGRRLRRGLAVALRGSGGGDKEPFGLKEAERDPGGPHHG